MKQLCIREQLRFLLQPLVVDVTQRDDLPILGGTIGITRTLATDADASHVHFSIWRRAQ